MKDQFFNFSRLVFVACVVLAILVGLLAAFIIMGGNARFHLIKDDGQTIEAEVNRKSAVPDSTQIDSSHSEPKKSGF